jgi:hypothetical protein
LNRRENAIALQSRSRFLRAVTLCFTKGRGVEEPTRQTSNVEEMIGRVLIVGCLWGRKSKLVDAAWRKTAKRIDLSPFGNDDDDNPSRALPARPQALVERRGLPTSTYNGYPSSSFATGGCSGAKNQKRRATAFADLKTKGGESSER